MIFLTDYVREFDIERHLIQANLVTYRDEFVDHEKVFVLLVWHEYIDAEFLQKFPNVRAIVRYGVGIDNIDISLCKEKGISVFNNPDYGVDEVSDTAVAMLLNAVRGIHAYDSIAKNLVNEQSGIWQESTLPHLKRLRDLTIGVLGVGRIGSSFISKIKPFVSDILVYDPMMRIGQEKALAVKRCWSLEELLQTADAVSIHCTQDEHTSQMIDESFVENCKPGMILINTARGGLIKDLDILYKGLMAGKFASICLDVLPEEPPRRCSQLLKIWLEGDKRIVINPHTAYFSEQSYFEMRSSASRLALDVLNGISKPLNQLV